MKKVLRIFILCAMASMMVGCYSTKQIPMTEDYEHACSGLTRNEVIARLGEPNRTYQNDIGDVLVYESYVGEQTVLNRKYVELTFDQQGVCRVVHTNYTKTEKYRDDKKTNWIVWGSIAGTAVGGGIVALFVHLFSSAHHK